jgi:hypothetical protein
MYVTIGGGSTPDLTNLKQQLGITALEATVAAGVSASSVNAIIAAYLASLPVYSGTGPAPVATGQPFLNGGFVQIAQ